MAEETNAATPSAALAAEPVANAQRVRVEEYKTNGKIVVKARLGYSFEPSNHDLPVVDDTTGITMTREQADVVLTEGGDYVFEVAENKE